MTGIMYRDASSSSVPQQDHHDTSSNPHRCPHRCLIMALIDASSNPHRWPDSGQHGFIGKQQANLHDGPDPICSVFSQPALGSTKRPYSRP